MSDSPRGITQREFARRMGVSPQAVHKRVAAGRLSRLADGTLDPAQAEREWHATRNPDIEAEAAAAAPSPGRQAGGAAPGTYAQAKTADTVYRARLRQLEYETRAGTYVRADATAQLWYDLARSVRTRLMAIPTRVAAELAAMSDVHAIRTLLDDEVRTALVELSEDASPTPR